jgi:hypothetical protein
MTPNYKPAAAVAYLRHPVRAASSKHAKIWVHELDRKTRTQNPNLRTAEAPLEEGRRPGGVGAQP